MIGKKSSLLAIIVVVASFLLLSQSGASYAYPSSRTSPQHPQQPQANCDRTSVGYRALTDMGSATYQGFDGGLYAGGANNPPAAYRQAGLDQASKVRPLDSNGRPSANGRIVLLSIGMSNTTQEYSTFKSMADADPDKNPRVAIVDGAVGGQDAQTIRNPSAPYWITVTQRLTNAGVTGNQVQAVWLKEAIAGVNQAFPQDAYRLASDLKAIVQILEQRYPNLQLVYLSSRTYAGYASSSLNPEPYAYQSGFAVKMLVQDRILNNDTSPWVAWGPYLWTNGVKGRDDGLVWLCSDTQSDGTHPSTTGRQKVATQLLTFFKTQDTTISWFLR